MTLSASASYGVTSTTILPIRMTGFPESFQRSTVTPSPSHDTQATTALWMENGEPSGRTMPSIISDVDSQSYPYDLSARSAVTRKEAPQSAEGLPSIGRGREYAPVPSPRRVSRSSMMRLENILNGVSINHDPVLTSRAPRSRSLGSVQSPIQGAIDIFSPPSPESATSAHGRSESSDDDIGQATATSMTIKKKKVKMHRCPECQKDFPRPSGLRTHMNMHTKEKPFACTYPGCLRSFSVVSNARRHMRTHGLGVSTDDTEQPAVPYVVGFEDPMVLDQPESLGGPGYSPSRSHPFRLRWIPLAASIPKSVDKKGGQHSSEVAYADGVVPSQS